MSNIVATAYVNILLREREMVLMLGFSSLSDRVVNLIEVEE